MRKYSFIIKKCASAISFWGIAAFASAQSLTVETGVAGIEGMPAVNVDNVWHATDGANIQFALTFVRSELSANQRNLQIQSVSCVFNGETKTGTLTDSNTFEFIGTPTSTPQVATITLTYSYEQQNEKGDYEKVTPEALVVLSEEIRIWDTPSCIIDMSTSAYQTENRTFTVSSIGGTDNWHYSWNGTEGGASYTEVKPASLPTRVNTQIEVKNYAPDGSTEWYVVQDTGSTYFYDNPTITVQSLANDLTFYKQLPDGFWSANVTGGGDTNEFLWYVNDVENKSQSNQFNPQTSAGNAVVKDVVKLVVVTYADDGTELWRSGELFNEEYTIYPQATLSADRVTKSIYLGESVTFAPTYNDGGYPTGNEYEWSGDMTSTSKDLTVTPSSTGTFTYVLKSQNKYGENVWEEYEEQTYTLNVYEQPSSVMTETINFSDSFENAQNVPTQVLTSTLAYPNTNAENSLSSVLDIDIVNLSVANFNGAESWTYMVSDNGNMLAEPYQLPQTEGVHQIVVSVVNGSDEMEMPYRAEYKHSYIIYPTPSAERTNGYMTSYETCGGRQVPLSVSVDGGDANGWSCQWEKDGNNIGGQTAYTYTDDVVYNASGDADMQSYVVGANVIYTLDGIVRFDKTINFDINYWPAPQNIADFTIVDVQNEKNTFNGTALDGATRQGNTLRFSAERAVGGYGNPSVWNYSWTKDGTVFRTYTTTDGWVSSFTEDAIVSMGSTKEYEDIVYTLRTYNYQGLWADNTVSKTVRVYNKPATPSALTKKGSGASGTMVALTEGVSDTDLEGRQYFLVFGYEDASGNEIKSFEKQQSNPGNTRFEAQFSSSEVNNSSNRFFVYALWKYDNDIRVTSGKRYINSVDEEWDGSDYTGATRAIVDDDATSIDKLFVSSPDNITKIYTLGGQIVKSPDCLSSGVYIVETISEGKRITKKLFVK